MAEVTRLLDDWRLGNADALEQLVPLVYAELRRIAVAQMRREPPGHALQPTALVHEVYLKLVQMGRVRLESRQHLLAFSARLMRQVLVDQARRQRARKRGRDVVVETGVEAGATHQRSVDVLALDSALEELAAFDARLRDLVDLKYFAGLTIAECAAALEVSSATVEREWVVARAWLFARLTQAPGDLTVATEG